MANEGPTPPSPVDAPTSAAPAIRWPFRVLALLFVAVACAASYGLARGWLRGDWQLGAGAFEELGTLVSCAVMTVVFAWAAATGQVPEPLWRLFRRFVRVS